LVSGVEDFSSFLGTGFSFFSAFDSGSEVDAEGVELPSGPRSLGTSIEDKSSPSSARIAMTCPTGILLLPSWTWDVSRSLLCYYQIERSLRGERRGKVENGEGAEGTYDDFTHYTIILSFNVDCRFIRFLS
jgi:hypothetical protein